MTGVIAAICLATSANTVTGLFPDVTGCHALDHRERDCKPRWLLFDVFTLGDSAMKAPFLITTYYPLDQSFIFACGSANAVRFFLRHMPQPVDFTMVSVAELKPDGTYENVLLDMFQ